MAVNLHELATELEKGIRQSQEYIHLRKMYDEVNADSEANGIFANFREIQMRLQEKQMSGQEISPEEVQQAQKTVAIVQQHEKISKLMEAEQRMSMVVADLNQIILKPLEELYVAPNE